MVVVKRTVLKQDEQRKLFLKKFFLKEMHEIKETIHLSLGRDRQAIFCFIGAVFGVITKTSYTISLCRKKLIAR